MMLQGKVAIVTGGGRDIGKAVSKKLAQEGAKVVINYSKNKERASETLAEIREIGGDAILVQGDVTKQSDVDKVISETIKTFGNEIHILVNVAGGLVARKTLEEMDEEFFTNLLRLNLVSAFLVTKAVVPYMKAGASIINFASQAGRDGGGAGSMAYATAKGSLMTFTRCLAKELGPSNIRVTAVGPGMIAITFHDTFTKAEVRKNVAASTPLRREGF